MRDQSQVNILDVYLKAEIKKRLRAWANFFELVGAPPEKEAEENGRYLALIELLINGTWPTALMQSFRKAGLGRTLKEQTK